MIDRFVALPQIAQKPGAGQNFLEQQVENRLSQLRFAFAQQSRPVCLVSGDVIAPRPELYQWCFCRFHVPAPLTWVEYVHRTQDLVPPSCVP